MPPTVRARSVKALKKMTKRWEKKKHEEKSSKCSCFNRKAVYNVEPPELEPPELPATALTPQLEKASNEGLNFIKEIAFPSIPALLQDLWVYLELFISMLAFALGIYGQFPISRNKAFQYTYFVLTVASTILALIDAYIYFVEIGSCARAIRYYKNKLRAKAEIEEEDEEARFDKKTCCKPEVKEKFHMFFEVGRNIITELILYPILIFDLFSFETEQTYDPSDLLDRIDYSLFIIGSFYLILAVYIMRLVVLIGSMLSLLRLPINDKSSSTSLLLKFCFHACGQILVHLMIILVIGAKINVENSMTGTNITDSMNISGNVSMDSDEDDDDPIIRASLFLWVSIVLGWLLPMAGTTAFFIGNYYWMKEFTIDFWLNMVSLLQGASFAESVLGGDGISETKEKTLQFVGDTDYEVVKKQMVKYKSPHWSTKFLYPAKVPVTAICGLLYDTCLIVFIVSLLLTYENGTIKFITLGEDDIIFTSIFSISISIILIANLHILLLLNSILLIALLTLFICIALFVFAVLPVMLFIYFPAIGLLGHALLFKKLCSFKKSTNQDTADTPIEEADYEMKEYI